MRRLYCLPALVLLAGGCSSSGSSDDPASGDSGAAAGGGTGSTLEDGNNPADGAITTIDASTSDEVVLRIIEVLNLVPLDPPRESALVLANELHQTGIDVIAGEAPGRGLTLLAQTPLTDASATPQLTGLLYDCMNGGQLDQTLTNFIDGAPFMLREVMFDNCELDASSYNGNYRTTAGFRSDTVAEFTDFTQTSGPLGVTLQGTYTDGFRMFGPAEARHWVNASYEMVDDDSSLSVTNLDWNRTGQDARVPDDTGRFFVTDLAGVEREILLVTYEADLRASFGYADNRTREAGLVVEAELTFSGNYYVWDSSRGQSVPDYPVSDLGTPLETKPGANAVDAPVRVVDQVPRDDNAQWQSGAVTVTAADGSSLSLTPDPADRSQVVVEIGGTGEVLLRSVDNGYQIDCPDVIDGC